MFSFEDTTSLLLEVVSASKSRLWKIVFFGFSFLVCIFGAILGFVVFICCYYEEALSATANKMEPANLQNRETTQQEQVTLTSNTSKLNNDNQHTNIRERPMRLRGSE